MPGACKYLLNSCKDKGASPGMGEFQQMVDPTVTGCWDKTPTPGWLLDIWADLGHREAQLGTAYEGILPSTPSAKNLFHSFHQEPPYLSLVHQIASLAELDQRKTSAQCHRTQTNKAALHTQIPRTGGTLIMTWSGILCSVPRWPHRFSPLGLKGVDPSRKRGSWCVQVLGTCETKGCHPDIQNATLKFIPKETKADRICLPWFNMRSPIVWDLEFVLTGKKGCLGGSIC